MEKGLVKIYFGEGKGKSTSSMGRALVCAGEEKEVFVIQFLKGKMTGMAFRVPTADVSVHW